MGKAYKVHKEEIQKQENEDRSGRKTMNLLRSFAVAFAMYSKIPVPNVEWNGKSMKYAMCFFPAVGAVAGFLQFLPCFIHLSSHPFCFFSCLFFILYHKIPVPGKNLIDLVEF